MTPCRTFKIGGTQLTQINLKGIENPRHARFDQLDHRLVAHFQRRAQPQECVRTARGVEIDHDIGEIIEGGLRGDLDLTPMVGTVAAARLGQKPPACPRDQQQHGNAPADQRNLGQPLFGGSCVRCGVNFCFGHVAHAGLPNPPVSGAFALCPANPHRVNEWLRFA